MSQKGVSFRLNSQVTAFAVLIISIIVYLNYHYSKKILIGKIEEGAINQSALVISNISRITIGTEEIARNVSYQALYYQQHNDLDLFLKQVLSSNPVLESIHIELLNDSGLKRTVFRSTDNYLQKCNSNQAVFPESENQEKGVWSKPFYCANDSSHLLVTYRLPIYKPDSEKIAGHVFCEISLLKMKQILAKLKIGSEGYVCVIDSDGNYIIHPQIGWIMKQNLFDKTALLSAEKSKLIQSKIKGGQSGASYAISEYLNNKPSWFYFAPLANTNWTVVIVVSEAELFKEIEPIFRKILWICGLGILFLFIMNMLIFRRILTPLADIAEAIQRFSSSGKEQKSKNEIKMLTDSFEDWQAKYGSLIKERAQTETEKIKYEKDLKSARAIQQNIIPVGKAVFPNHPEIDLFAILKPAEKIGGDLYDYFFIDKSHLLIAIGDVSGKGIPASLFMAVASTLVKTNARILSSRDLVEKVNRELSNRNSDQYFLTLFVGILDVNSGVIDYCNAAHNYPYILRGDGSLQTLSTSHGLPLGIYKDKKYESSTIELNVNDTMILYTDGVINSIDAKNRYYGTERLEKNLLNMSDLSSEEVVGKLLNSIMIFKGDSVQSDDISLLVLKYLNKTESQF